MAIKNNYYISALSWSVIQKVLTALFGFISTPLLLGIYGKADYGLLTIATACNGYMQLLDLGMNTGAVRYFSIWKAEGNIAKSHRVARTNLTFYGIIAIVNILMLLALAWFGEPLFSIGHIEFLTLRVCLYILSIFCLFNWLTTVYNQLLIADQQMTFTMKMNCLSLVARVGLLVCVLTLHLSLTTYFFFLTAIVASLIIPYSWKCLRDKLIDSFKPAFYWTEFKPVVVFSLSIFALSLFQMTSTQTRPIILSMFAEDGASSVTDFSIISVFPSLIIMIAGTFSGVFLPKTSEMVKRGDLKEQHLFAYKWTIFTSIIANCLCFPFIIGASDIISAYVGNESAYLAPWLIIWVVCTLLQTHSTPTTALILGYGKTKIMVYVTGIACIISMVINAILARYYSTGSAIIGYAIYIVITLIAYYGYYYQKTLKVSNVKILESFLNPTLCGTIAFFVSYILIGNIDINILPSIRLNYLVLFGIKACVWLVFFLALILGFKIVNVKDKMILTKYDKQENTH